MSDITLRPATIPDIPAIRQIAETSWWAHYPGIISDDQIRFMLALMYDAAKLEQALVSGHQLMLAELSGIPSAFCQSEDQGDWRFIHKLYAVPAAHGKGLGKRLLAEAAAHGKPLRLHVNRHNPTVGFYKAQGFTVLKEQVTDIGNGYVMDDYVMERSLAA